MFQQKSSIDFDTLTKIFAGSRFLSSKTIFEAMESNDISDVIFFIIFRSKMPDSINPNFDQKSDDKSKTFYEDGDAAVELKEALYHYNKALMHAPKNSKAMKIIYCKRSALLFKWKAYTACLRDVEIFTNNHSGERILDETMNKLKEKANQFLIRNRLGNQIIMETFGNEGTVNTMKYYDFNVERNLQIPCVSADIEFQRDSQSLKAVATKDISIGTVLALETAYVTFTSEENRHYSCYYCQKFNMNLIPCDNCAFVLFCNDNCKKLCLEEYHQFECRLLPIIPREHTFDNVSLITALKAALKLKSKCTWDEFIKESYIYGNNRINQSSVEEMYDVNYKFSPLTFRDDDPFVCSKMSRVSSHVAHLVISLHHMSFYPSEPHKKTLALKAFARVFMYFILYSNAIDMPMASRPGPLSIKFELKYMNSGLFSFSSKLKQVHLSNVIPVPVANKIALVTIRCIKKGDEITTPLYRHWLEGLDASMSEEGILMYKKTTCNNCILCSHKYEAGLTPLEKKQLDDLNLEKVRKNFKESFNNHKKYCKGLTILNNKPYTAEYLKVYHDFKSSLLELLDIHCITEYLRST